MMLHKKFALVLAIIRQEERQGLIPLKRFATSKIKNFSKIYN
jgi:hypothetical protein